MATWLYPPLSPEQRKTKEEESLARELQWLLHALQDSIASLKGGLEECVALLAPKEPGSTLVLSSWRSESIKGFVTRIGTRIVKADVNLRLSSLAPNLPRGTPTYPSTRYTLQVPTVTTSHASDSTLTLTPLVNLANHLNASLDLIDVTPWTGQSTSAPFIRGQLRLLSDQLASARACLQGHHRPDPTAQPGEEWWLHSVSASMFDPPLHPNLSLHLAIRDASLVLTVRTLSPVDHNHNHQHQQHQNNNSNNNAPYSSTAPPGSNSLHLKTSPAPLLSSSRPATPPHPPAESSSGFNLRDRLSGLGLGLSLGLGIGATRQPTHDETGEIFPWRGSGHVDVKVRVREKVRVESADPSLMSVAAKLSALEHELGRWRLALAVVMADDLADDLHDAGHAAAPSRTL